VIQQKPPDDDASARPVSAGLAAARPGLASGPAAGAAASQATGAAGSGEAPASSPGAGAAGSGEAAAGEGGRPLTSHGPAVEAAEPDEPPVPPAQVADVLAALEKAVRAKRLYQANNPVYQGFIAGMHGAFAALWEKVPALSLNVEEHAFRWHNRSFSAGQGRDSLPFLFYKDGVRHLAFMPGFEDEALRFLEVIDRARAIGGEGDEDMVTLLWQEEFESFQYSYVDALAEGLSLPGAVGADARAASRVDPGAVAGDAQHGDPAEQSPLVMSGQPTVAASITRDDFDETTYFLDVEELEQLRIELQREMHRDVRNDVLNALFDRLDEPLPERQLEIVRILRQMLPTFLARGDLRSASKLLDELRATMQQPVLQERERREALDLLRELGEPAVLGQLFRALGEGAIDPTSRDLGVFLGHLGPDALPLLVQGAESSEDDVLRERLTTAIQNLAAQHPEQLVSLLSSREPAIAAGAARIAGRLGRGDAAPAVVALLAHGNERVRLAAAEALARIANGVALDGLRRALADPDRDVRIAAARGLSTVRYAPSRGWLEQYIQSREVRDADLTEKIAFFEAYGAVANAASVELLDRMLNGRKLFGRESPEIRACAAMALGRIGTPAASESLRRASDEQNPIIRNAVVKALRQESAR
jgi:HEAT repeat protein